MREPAFMHPGFVGPTSGPKLNSAEAAEGLLHYAHDLRSERPRLVDFAFIELLQYGGTADEHAHSVRSRISAVDREP